METVYLGSSIMTPRIGFCCKYMLDTDVKKSKSIAETERKLNTSSTTVAWLNRQTTAVAEAKLWQVMRHNLSSVQHVLALVATMDPRQRMMRLSSDLLPMYTEKTWGYFWQQPDVKRYCEHEFTAIGEFARTHDIRLSFHPGQFCVLASIDMQIVERSIAEFEYHVDMARMMGYGAAWHDHGFKINVHISGRQGPSGINRALNIMTPEARNLITIENDENSWGIESSLELENNVALVLDIHHHLLNSEGQYITPVDDRWKRIVDSWRGVRPVIHYSISREDILINHDSAVLPQWDIIRLTHKKAKLRAHSDTAWNAACNDWALRFWPDADIQCEMKFKNIASTKLFMQAIA